MPDKNETIWTTYTFTDEEAHQNAKDLAQKRCPDLSPAELAIFAELALSCGMKSAGHNGCVRYNWLGKEFVVDQRGGETKVVTVI